MKIYNTKNIDFSCEELLVKSIKIIEEFENELKSKPLENPFNNPFYTACDASFISDEIVMLSHFANKIPIIITDEQYMPSMNEIYQNLDYKLCNQLDFKFDFDKDDNFCNGLKLDDFACYLHHKDSNKEDLSMIYICPERIWKIYPKGSKKAEALFVLSLLHALAHATLDIRNNDICSKDTILPSELYLLLEEAIATHFASCYINSLNINSVDDKLKYASKSVLRESKWYHYLALRLFSIDYMTFAFMFDGLGQHWIFLKETLSNEKDLMEGMGLFEAIKHIKINGASTRIIKNFIADAMGIKHNNIFCCGGYRDEETFDINLTQLDTYKLLIENNLQTLFLN